ncbi:MAG: pyruvate dehydrogenase (acetyl-transferring), homodimeric type [Acidobacteriota bacterium]|nr:pyruvate dehydrogenase (acetyl-transferring), homodimeric type [Acidobacteriota bacterium]MDH3784960.1 pyruvate dehydrogenase (acetyl-transferring), homodimeric type [Acidobacteriota bacterium]
MSDLLKDPLQEEIVAAEEREWLESLDYVIKHGGSSRVRDLLLALQRRAAEFGITLPYSANTPYTNTIVRADQPRFPGNREIERRIKSILRWNAMAMVVQANRSDSGIGGHISTYASAATLYEVAFNHFFRGKDHPSGGDQIYFQGHASPGIYARAFLEGRLTEEQLKAFRRELKPGGGLPSYPHPRAMPGFWEFPTVSMGLGPIMAIYQARFNRYLEDRGLVKNTGRVWAFLGDGETDEPEALGAISLAAREKLDNLNFVINCNLQRLDGPVRGNGKIIQELEAIFRGAGWNVIKVVWGDSWDPLLANDPEGRLVKRMEEAVDGDYQKYSVEGGGYIREHFFGTHPDLKELVSKLTDTEISKLRRGGHDPEKVYAAYKAAVEHEGAPTVILAKTVKGYGLGEAGEGKNITHQQKKLNESELREFRARFGIPISDDEVGEAPFYRPPDDSPEMRYLRERRMELGGSVPSRVEGTPGITAPDHSLFEEFDAGSGGREASTTAVAVRLLSKLLKDEQLGPHVVPIVPDEARTFGMESLFRQVGIYSHVGQRYEPVDKETLLYYKEATDGQILEEGITEAGSLCSFIAAGTSHSSHGVNMIPFFIFYSMFGFQRIGDLIWAAGDMRCRGFLVGGTAGRTTLAGEGLQHQDGHSQLLAYSHPHVVAYDPAFAYELAAMLEDGIQRMYVDRESVCYYLTVGNEPYAQPAMPEGVRDGILRGLYRFNSHDGADAGKLKLLGSGAIMNEVLAAQALLQEHWGIASEAWSATSYQQLYRDGLDADRKNRLSGKNTEVPFVRQALGEDPETLVVAASDYSQALPHSISHWAPGRMVVLGTDGFGRSENRESLREYFEVNARHIAWAALAGLARENRFPTKKLPAAAKTLNIDSSKANAADF